MTAVAVGAPETRERPSSSPSRWPRVREFLLTGGLTPFFFVGSYFLRRAMGLDWSEYTVSFAAFYAAFVINDPHFTVTYFLFYRNFGKRLADREQPLSMRIRWIVAGIVAPAILVVWALGALVMRMPPVLGWMVQLMYFLVGWHYVKQGFGVLAVLSSRHGVKIEPRERIVILAHCFAGWAFAWANPAGPAGDFEEKGLVYRGLAHPKWLELGAGTLLALTTVALVGVMVARFVRDRTHLPLGPLAGLLITIWSWTIFSGIDPLVRYVIPGLHSIQYLYFVWLMRSNEARAQQGPPSFGRPLAVRMVVLALASLALGWFLFHGAPAFLDEARSREATKAFGDTPFLVCFFVFVNVHHYVMDHVIWRRENPDTRWLRV